MTTDEEYLTYWLRVHGDAHPEINGQLLAEGLERNGATQVPGDAVYAALKAQWTFLHGERVGVPFVPGQIEGMAHAIAAADRARAATRETPGAAVLAGGETIDMLLWCPSCHAQHIDEPDDYWTNPPHKSHLCGSCGLIWRPADLATNGVRKIKTKGTRDTFAPEECHLIPPCEFGKCLDKAAWGATDCPRANETAGAEALKAGRLTTEDARHSVPPIAPWPPADCILIRFGCVTSPCADGCRNVLCPHAGTQPHYTPALDSLIHAMARRLSAPALDPDGRFTVEMKRIWPEENDV